MRLLSTVSEYVTNIVKRKNEICIIQKITPCTSDSDLIKILWLKTNSLHKVSVAQVVEWQIRDLEEAGSSPSCYFGAATAEFAEFDLT